MRGIQDIELFYNDIRKSSESKIVMSYSNEKIGKRRRADIVGELGIPNQNGKSISLILSRLSYYNKHAIWTLSETTLYVDFKCRQKPKESNKLNTHQ